MAESVHSPLSVADTNSSRATTTVNTASTPTLDDHFDLRTYLEPLYNAQVAVDQSSGVSSCLGVKFQSKLGIVTFMPTAHLRNEEHSVVCAIPGHEASHTSRNYGYPYVYNDANSVVYVIGRGEDCVNVIESIRSIANAYRTLHHVDMPTRMLTMKIGDMLHKCTLLPGARRPRAVNLLCVDRREAHMYKVDVAGNIFFARALALGRHSADRTQWLSSSARGLAQSLMQQRKKQDDAHSSMPDLSDLLQILTQGIRQAVGQYQSTAIISSSNASSSSASTSAVNAIRAGVDVVVTVFSGLIDDSGDDSVCIIPSHELHNSLLDSSQNSTATEELFEYLHRRLVESTGASSSLSRNGEDASGGVAEEGQGGKKKKKHGWFRVLPSS
eukprot:gene29608-35742_t